MPESNAAREDHEIIALVLNGHQDAFECLLKRYQNYVLAIVSRKVPYDSVEEVAHEVFIQVFKSLPTYTSEHPFRHWLARITVRTCHTYWRRTYRNREVPASSLGEETKDWLEQVLAKESIAIYEEEAGRWEAGELLDWALSKLSATNRMIITLTYFEGYSAKETADLLSMSVTNVKVRAHRARRALLKQLASLFDRSED